MDPLARLLTCPRFTELQWNAGRQQRRRRRGARVGNHHAKPDLCSGQRYNRNLASPARLLEIPPYARGACSTCNAVCVYGPAPPSVVRPLDPCVLSLSYC